MMSKMLVLLMVGAATATQESKDATHAWKWTSRADDQSQCQATVDVEIDGEVVTRKTCVGGNKFSNIGGVPRCAHIDDASKNCIIPNCPGSDGGSGKACKMMRPGSVGGGAGAESLNPSRPSSSMRDTTLENKMRGWKDVDKAQFLGFPSTLLSRRALVPSVRTKADFTMELHCAEGGAGDMCDHFVFMYNCPPCQFANGGVGFIPSLLSEGFVPHHCQTVFDLNKEEDSALHDVVIYHKQTLAGETDTIQNNELLEFVWYSASAATTFCPAIGDESECDLSSECSWKNDACLPNFCPGPKKPRGPWKLEPKCQVCPHGSQEKDYIPPIDM